MLWWRDPVGPGGLWAGVLFALLFSPVAIRAIVRTASSVGEPTDLSPEDPGQEILFLAVQIVVLPLVLSQLPLVLGLYYLTCVLSWWMLFLVTAVWVRHPSNTGPPGSRTGVVRRRATAATARYIAGTDDSVVDEVEEIPAPRPAWELDEAAVPSAEHELRGPGQTHRQVRAEEEREREAEARRKAEIELQADTESG